MVEPRIINRAFEWIERGDGEGFLEDNEHCPTRDVFAARLNQCNRDFEIQDKKFLLSSLVVAVAGELGNNAFDHNLGNWRDIPGVYFQYDIPQRLVVIADRGQGVLATLRRIRPQLRNDEEALRTAFTETISGRSPEQRGNGLKFIARVIRERQWKLEYYSGSAIAHVHSTIDISEYNPQLRGVLAVVSF